MPPKKTYIAVLWNGKGLAGLEEDRGCSLAHLPLSKHSQQEHFRNASRDTTPRPAASSFFVITFSVWYIAIEYNPTVSKQEQKITLQKQFLS